MIPREQLKAELIERLEKMDRVSLERVRSILDRESLDYTSLPDVRVQRTPEQINEFKALLRDLGQLEEGEASFERRPLRAEPLEFQP